MPATSFTDPVLVAGPLYATAGRLVERTGALHAAKISGGDATATIVDLAARSAVTSPVVCDIGCGRGTTTWTLAVRLDPHEIEQALQTYNTYTAQLNVDTGCSPEQLRVYAEFHHQLTARYLHRNGYRHTWPDVRPWQEPEVPR